MTPATFVALLAGAAWGGIADRIAARWPAHEDGRIRARDWRTVAVILIGAASLGLLADRFASEPATALFLGLYVTVLVLLFATDLDQRLLPDVATLPLVPYALLGFILAAGPFVTGPTALAWAAGAAIALPGLLFLLSIPFGAGAIGLGDLKLLVSVGLLVGAGRLVIAVVSGAILAAVVVVVLLAARRITLRTYIPYGPFLILGALWAILVRLETGG